MLSKCQTLVPTTKLGHTIYLVAVQNGAFFYRQHSNAMGFAPNNSISLNNADTTGSSDATRLSLHLTGSDGGYRAGSNTSPGSSVIHPSMS